MRGKGGRKQRNLNDSGHFADASKPENLPRGKTKIVITVAYGTESQKNNSLAVHAINWFQIITAYFLMPSKYFFFLFFPYHTISLLNTLSLIL